MIIDLKDKSGLGIKLDIDKPELTFDKDIKFSLPTIRTINQMREVLLDKNIQEPEELYYMYRGIHRSDDESILDKHSLRYDVTVIKPFCLGKEFMKTAGHYHPEGFPELYEVISGRCFCLLQRHNLRDYRIIEEIIFIEAAAGQKIIIPPGFGHILINPGPDYLVTANWVSCCFESSYELYKKAKGAAYFVIASSDDSEVSSLDLGVQPQGFKENLTVITSKLRIGVKFIKNNNFLEMANICFAQPVKEIRKFGLTEDSPIYNLINENNHFLDFLNHPLSYEYGDVFVR